MKDIIKTRRMESDHGAVRVPVMVQRNLAAELADFVLQAGKVDYDDTLEMVIKLGIEEARKRDKHSPRTKGSALH